MARALAIAVSREPAVQRLLERVDFHNSIGKLAATLAPRRIATRREIVKSWEQVA